MKDFVDKQVRRVVAFLTEIGITVRRGNMDQPTFLPGLRLDQGELVVDEAKLAHPGDLLHEAGHIAVTEGAERRDLNDDIEMPIAIGGGFEMAAIAWSYAAAVHLELDPAVVFHEAGYKGGSASLLENFAIGHYIGVPVLQWVGMTYDEAAAEEAGAKPFPHMIKWLR